MLWKDEPTNPRGMVADCLQCRVVFQSAVSRLAEYHSNPQDAIMHAEKNKYPRKNIKMSFNIAVSTKQ